MMLSFLKSLRFWHYRKLYLACLEEKATLAFEANMDRRVAKAALDELQRIRAILAPYGERILAGQADGTTGMIRLPALEFEMAKAFFHANACMSEDMRVRLLSAGFSGYSWRGRNVRCVEHEAEHAA